MKLIGNNNWNLSMFQERNGTDPSSSTETPSTSVVESTAAVDGLIV